MFFGTTEYNFVARKVVSETVIMVVHLNIVNILKKITNPETDPRILCVFTNLKQFFVMNVLCFHLFGSDIEFVLVFTSFKYFICVVQNTTSNLIIFSL